MNLLQKSGLTEFVILNEVKNLLFFNDLYFYEILHYRSG